MATEQTTVEYREIEGFPGYRVGNDGSVWSRHARGRMKGHSMEGERLTSVWRRLRVPPTGKGKYPTANLQRDGVAIAAAVHRLILAAFVGPCPAGFVCRHRDGDSTNNRLENLTWGTPKQNEADKKIHGTQPMGDGHYKSKLTAAKVKELRRRHASGERVCSLAREAGVTSSAISMAISGRSWAHVED